MQKIAITEMEVEQMFRSAVMARGSLGQPSMEGVVETELDYVISILEREAMKLVKEKEAV
jgi:hypothetical protein